jgi:hypothetical protein
MERGLALVASEHGEAHGVILYDRYALRGAQPMLNSVMPASDLIASQHSSAIDMIRNNLKRVFVFEDWRTDSEFVGTESS